METEKLTQIVQKARRGDETAMQDLYLDAYRSVYYLALRVLKNPEDAEDITQEVFITVHEKIAELREPAAFYAWVNQITVNKCNRLLGKYPGIARLDDGEEILALVDDNPLNLPDKAIDDEATRKIILDIIDNLPDGQRVCVMLYYYSQNTITQIAEMLDINENTVKSRLALARAKIRAALEEKEKKEGIKLYGIPLALTPILRQAMEQFVMPEDVAGRIWENVSKATSGSAPGNGGSAAEPPGTPGAGSSATGTAATGMTMAAKIIIGVIAAAVIAAGAFIIPRLMETPPEETPPAVITDAATTAPNTAETSPPPAPEQIEASQPEEPTDDGSAPIPLDFRFEADGAENMMYWYVAEFTERVAGFELSAAAVGTDDWTPIVTTPADHGGYQIELLAACLDAGEYRIRLTTLANDGYSPSKPAYIENGTLTVKWGNHPKNSYTVEKFDDRFSLRGFDEHSAIYYMDITRNGVRVNNVWFDTRWRADVPSAPVAFPNGYGDSQPGDMVTFRELLDVAFDGANYTVTFAEPSDPIVIP